MNEENEEENGGTSWPTVAILIGLILYVFLSQGFVLAQLWNWFLYPHVAEITWINGIGLALMLEFIKNPHRKFLTDMFAYEVTSINEFWLNALAKPWMVFVAGIFVYECMIRL